MNKRPASVALEQFLNKCNSIEKSPKEDVDEYVERAKNGDKQASFVVQCSLAKYIVKVVYKYASIYNIDVEDLFMSSIVGVQKAISNYDKSKGTKFFTYAYYWILCEIRNCVKEQLLISIPFSLKKYYATVKEIIAILYAQNETMPTPEEVAEASGLSINIVKDVMDALSTYYLSIDSYCNMPGFEDETIENYIYGQVYTNSHDGDFESEVEENVIDKFISEQLLYVMEYILTDTEKCIIKYRFGFVDGKQWALQDIAELIRQGVTCDGKFIQANLHRKKVASIIDSALLKLRKFLLKEMENTYDNH